MRRMIVTMVVAGMVVVTMGMAHGNNLETRSLLKKDMDLPIMGRSRLTDGRIEGAEP
jgi:hypothetical protein